MLTDRNKTRAQITIRVVRRMRYLVIAALTATPLAVSAASPQEQTQQDTDASVPLAQCGANTAKLMQPIDNDLDAALIRTEAKKIDSTVGGATRLSGGVKIQQGQRSLSADQADIDRDAGTLEATGNVTYLDPWVEVTSESLAADITTHSARLDNAEYEFAGQSAKGQAASMEIEKGQKVILREATFTTCPEGDNSWRLEADKIQIDGEEEWGESRHSWLYVKDVPVFYFPYLSFPVSDKRKSGFLFPSIGNSSDSGAKVKTPYYWNIAPNYDLTFTPNYMSDRGLLAQTEFRYLLGDEKSLNSGELHLEYMDKDDELFVNDDRYLFHWRHFANFGRHVRGYVDYTNISDDNYFNDLDAQVGTSTYNRVEQMGQLGYFDENWYVNAIALNYDVLGDSQQSHKLLPGLVFNYTTPSVLKRLDFDLYGEFDNFEHSDNDLPTASRLHLEPTLSYPIGTPSGYLLSELKLYQTFYEQDDPTNQLSTSTNRTLPSFRLFGTLNFERETEMFDQSFTQTLEPKIQYLYVPHTEQDDIGIYDTDTLSLDYESLFRSRRYSGYDRIADANQLTLGVTTRFLNDNFQERFNFSIGQIIYLSNSDVTLFDESSRITDNNSSVVTSMDLFWNEEWSFHQEFQQDVDDNRTEQSETELNYRPGKGKWIRFSHRYLPDITEDNELSQFGVQSTWPISDTLHLVGSYYRDGKEHRSIESYFGLQMESCCYAIRLGYHRHINTNYEEKNAPDDFTRDQFDSGIWLEVVIKGLSSGQQVGYQDMLSDTIFGGRRSYYLNY